MESLKECKEAINLNFSDVSSEVKLLEDNFGRFFIFDLIFSSENSGKTRLNRQEFNENDERIQGSILIIEEKLDTCLELIKETIRNLLAKHNDFNKVDLSSLLFDDKNFLELLQMDLDVQVIPAISKKELLADLRVLTRIKNKIFNLKYYVNMFNTNKINKHINRLGMEELINSRTMFEILNTYGYKANELKNFQVEIKELDAVNYKTKYFNFLDDLLQYHSSIADTFTYANVRYKISLNYDIDLDLSKQITIKRAYLENIISNLIEQSCVDVVKKELKRGKIQKYIDLDIRKKKKNLQIIIKNNGYEVNNIHSLYLSSQDNKYIIETKNLISDLNGKLEIEVIPNEGMQYSVEFPTK